MRPADGFPDHEPCDRATDPDRWQEVAWSDTPAVIQVRDGLDPEPGEPAWASSSVSQPSIVASTLLALDVLDSHRVLEIDTGGGWNAGLLTHRLGHANVVTVEVDPALAAAARDRLDALGLLPQVVTATAPTAGPRRPLRPHREHVLGDPHPTAWLDQVRPGGLTSRPGPHRGRPTEPSP
ncbi:hypothetical protein [Embleya sp. NPDC050493]|uniref:hypothetical protein n=1 Tax=Embleya sp. NPDC050493 TaxID=3363989 RepID=UPI0037A1A40A